MSGNGLIDYWRRVGVIYSGLAWALGKGPYSWWSNRGQAREKDRGWRIDYVLANAAGAPLLQRASVMREGGLVVSDHAPVIVDLDI